MGQEMPKITDKIPALQDMLKDGKLEKSLRKLSESDGQASFSMTLSPQQTSYSFSATSSDGTSENYSKTVPFISETPSPLPPGETA